MSGRRGLRCTDSRHPVARPAIFRHLRGGHDARVAAGRSAGVTAMMHDGSIDEEVPASGRADGDAPLKLEEFLLYRLNVVASLASQALSRIYAERYGIGVPEWRVLVTLGQYGAMTGKQIGAHSHMHKTKVSRAVTQLEKRKLLIRRANRADLREAF